MSDRLYFSSIREFYPYYLIQHREWRCRTLHFIGTALVKATFIISLVMQSWWLLIALPFIGYGFAWAGHFLFERNKPAAFNNPLYSLPCDFIMFWDILTGRVGKKIREAESRYASGNQ